MELQPQYIAIDNTTVMKSIVHNLETFENIWNFKCTDYHDKEKRERDFCALADICKLPVDVLKRKYATIRTRFRKEYNEMTRKTLRSDTENTDVPQPTWKFYEDLKFLLPTLKSRSCLDSVATCDGEDAEDDVSVDSPEGCVTVVPSASKVSTKKRTTDDSCGSESAKRQMFEAVGLASRGIQHHRIKEDGFYHFAQLIIEDLRSFEEPLRARVLMNRIQTMITDELLKEANLTQNFSQMY